MSETILIPAKDASKPKQTIQIRNIKPRARKWQGQTFQGTTEGDWHADIVPGVSIRIFGNFTNHVNGPQAFDKTFKIGDKAEYDSYNLRYVGTIEKVAAATVTINHGYSYRSVTQLQLSDFVRKNWGFDMDKITKHNNEESQYL